MSKLTYAEKLLDPRWQKKRLEIMQRDNFTCRACHSATDTLHVHHRHYIKGAQPWEYADFMLLTLCKDCHAKMEQARQHLLQVIETPEEALDAALLVETLKSGGKASLFALNVMDFIKAARVYETACDVSTPHVPYAIPHAYYALRDALGDMTVAAAGMFDLVNDGGVAETEPTA